MDNFFDDFITYDNQFEPLLDFEPNFSLSSPFTETSDSTGLVPSYLPKTIKNLLDIDEVTQNKGPTLFDGISFDNVANTQQKPLDIFTQNREEYTETSEMTETITNTPSPDVDEVKEESESKLNKKTKKITKPKKEKAKKDKPKKKMDAETLIKKADSKHIPEGFFDPNVDEETKKKMIQMVRNRMSAQNSRDKKKVHLHQLEEENRALREEQTNFAIERKTLLERIQQLEAEKAQLTQQINSDYLCSKCGCTMDYSDPAPSQDTNGSTGVSNPSSPVLSRNSSQGGRFFGFSFAFAAVMCILLFINGGQLDNFKGPGNGRATTKLLALVQKVQKLAGDFDNNGMCKNPEEIPQPTMVAEERILSQLAEPIFGDFPILSKIKNLMDQFRKHHSNVYQSSEFGKKVIQLQNSQSMEQKALNSKVFNHTFLGQKPVVTSNKTSTLFCPSGFEFFQNTPTVEIGEEFKMNAEFSDNHNGVELKSKTLDLEKAEYVQLLLPKNSIGRMGVTENSSEPYYQQPEEEDSIIEVWCKIFAVKEMAATF